MYHFFMYHDKYQLITRHTHTHTHGAATPPPKKPQKTTNYAADKAFIRWRPSDMIFGVKVSLTQSTFSSILE